MTKKSKAPSQHEAPDPARSYERAKPEAESGMGRLDAPKTKPARRDDGMKDAVKHAQRPRQLNAEDATDNRARRKP
jgi:hypothetical protein